MYNENIGRAINKKIKVSEEECRDLQTTINIVYNFFSELSKKNGIESPEVLKKIVLDRLEEINEEYVKNANVRSNFVTLEAINILLEDPQRLRTEIEKAKTVKKQGQAVYDADINKNMQLIVREVYSQIKEFESDEELKKTYKIAKKNKDKKSLKILGDVLEGSMEERIRKSLITLKESITKQVKDSQINSLMMTYETLLSLGAIDRYRSLHNQQVVRIRM